MIKTLKLCVVASVALAIGCDEMRTKAPPVEKGAAFPDNWFMHPTAAERQKQNKLVGEAMPPLELSSWIGKSHSAESLQGKVVVLDFWATWCGPCLAQIPHNNEIYDKYKDRDLVFIGVCTSDDQEKMPTIARQFSVRYPLGCDAKLKAIEDWRLSFFPTYAIVDRSGKVRGVGLKPNVLNKAIDRLLAE